MIRRVAYAVALSSLLAITSSGPEVGVAPWRRPSTAGFTDRSPSTSPCPVGSAALVWMVDPDVSRIWCRPTPGSFGPPEAIAWAIASLAAGPDPVEAREGAYGEVPSRTVVRSITRGADRWWVDVSAEVESGGGTASMIGRTTQLRRTLTALPGVDAVQILVEGAAIDAWGGEGLMTSWPWSAERR